MKLTKSKLRQIIQEELRSVLMNEGYPSERFEYAKSVTRDLCNAGYSISDSRALFDASGQGRADADAIISRAASEGPECCGLKPFGGSPITRIADCAKYSQGL